jgi:hypothetical protein
MNMHISVATEADHTAHSSWEVALANRNAAKRAYDHHHTTVWLPLADELDRISPRPDLSFEIEARSGQVARYLAPANDLPSWDNHWSPVFRQKAAAVRDAWLAYRADCERPAGGGWVHLASGFRCRIEEGAVVFRSGEFRKK